MNILIAPDKFKGSLDAFEVCRAIAEAFTQADKKFDVQMMPMADGGEGTYDMLTRFSDGTKINCKVFDPFFREINAEYGLSGDGTTAFIEMATASGLQLLKPEERDALEGTTYGTGQLIADALTRGVKKIILGIGGSATTDGGMGMAAALGIHFFSADGKRLSPAGKNLIRVHTIDSAQRHPALQHVSFTALCDVNNPLYGLNGAAHTFAPQKGADRATVQSLDEGLQNFASVINRQFDLDVNFPGAGAGGGLPAMAKVLFNIQFVPGIDFLMQYIGLDDLVRESDVVITGEGKVDSQTLSGKVVKGIADLSRKYKKPLFVIAGKNELTEDSIRQLGVEKVVTLVDANTSEQEAIKDTFHLIHRRIKEEIIPLFL